MKLSTIALTIGLTLVASFLSVTASTYPSKDCSYKGLLPLYEQCLKSGKPGTKERANCAERILNPKAISCVANFGDSKQEFLEGLAYAVEFSGDNRPEAVMEFMATWATFH